MLLKGENIPSSEGFSGQEDSSGAERQVSAEPHALRLFPLERFRVQPQGKVAISSCIRPWNSYDIARGLYRILRIATLLFILLKVQTNTITLQVCSKYKSNCWHFGQFSEILWV